MKRFFSFLISVVLFLPLLLVPAAAERPIRIMTSFYPIYILSLNVFKNVENVSLECMTAPETGCLHDYQLMVGDMMKLSDSDAFIVCGAGMEPYLPDIRKQFSALPIIDCSQGIDLIVETHEDGEEEANAHTWLDVQNAIQIIVTIAEEASSLFPNLAEQIHKNALAYTNQLNLLDEHLKEMLSPVSGNKIVTFHEAFPYFARAYGLEIAAVISEEHEETLSPSQLDQVIQAVRDADNPPLFTEPQYSADAAYAIAAETGAALYELDPLVSGEMEPEAYEKGMLKNAQALLNAFIENK